MKSIYKIISDSLLENKEFVVATIVSSSDSTPRKSGAKMIIFSNGKSVGTIGGGILEFTVIEDSKNILNSGNNIIKNYNIGAKNLSNDTKKLPAICGGEVTIYFEVFKKKDKVFIFGCGHVAQKLSALLDVIEFPYYMIDNREEYAVRDNFSGALEVYRMEYDEIQELPIDNQSYCVIMTHGHKFDALCMEKLLNTDAKYIGMIGSSKKVKTNLLKIYNKGNKIDNRVFSPIGLDISGSEPGNLAVSVLAEILAVQKGITKINHLRDKFVNKYCEDREIKELINKGGLFK